MGVQIPPGSCFYHKMPNTPTILHYANSHSYFHKLENPNWEILKGSFNEGDRGRSRQYRIPTFLGIEKYLIENSANEDDQLPANTESILFIPRLRRSTLENFYEGLSATVKAHIIRMVASSSKMHLQLGELLESYRHSIAPDSPLVVMVDDGNSNFLDFIRHQEANGILYMIRRMGYADSQKPSA